MAALRRTILFLLITSAIPWATFALIPIQFKSSAELNKQQPANQPVLQTNCNPSSLPNQTSVNNNNPAPVNTLVTPPPTTYSNSNIPTNLPSPTQSAAPVTPSNPTASGGILLSNSNSSSSQNTNSNSDSWVIY